MRWARGAEPFLRQKYSRGHTWHFDEGVTVPASASPLVLRPPLSVAAAVDPEEALVAALSSCHMLFVLSKLSKLGYIAESYEDTGEAVMHTREDGKTALTAAVLRPMVRFKDRLPTPEEYARVHEESHEECYIANSVNFPVVIEPEMALG